MPVMLSNCRPAFLNVALPVLSRRFVYPECDNAGHTQDHSPAFSGVQGKRTDRYYQTGVWLFHGAKGSALVLMCYTTVDNI